MFIEYNPNPIAARVGDCAVRALSKALEQDWETTFIELSVTALQMCDMPSSNAVWGAYLRKHGFYRDVIPNECPDCYNVDDFCAEHPTGTFVLTLKNHVVCIKDGDLYDSWNSSHEIPLYFWYRREKSA